MPYTRFSGFTRGPQLERADILPALLQRMQRRHRQMAGIGAALERWDKLSDVTGDEALTILAEWVREHATLVDASGCIFAVSGGVDSSLVAIICHRALPDRCRGLIMPDSHSDPSDQEDAIRLLDGLGVPYKVVPVGETVDVLLRQMGQTRDSVPHRDVGNLASRLRIATMYCEACLRGEMVVGGGDMDEVYIGYSSKGLAWDLYPINGLHKDEVRALVYRGLQHLGEDLARRLSERPATPGFWKGQQAEEQIGLSYTHVGRIVEVIARHCPLLDTGIFPQDVQAFLTDVEEKGIAGEDLLGVVDMMMSNYDLVMGSPVLGRPGAAG